MAERRYILYPVWDPLLRGVHWWNVLTLCGQLVTGAFILYLGEELDHMDHEGLVGIHLVFGYLFAAGLLVRTLWLFTGPESARLRDLLPVTRAGRRVLWETVRFYLGLLRGTPPLYRAHNPFAGIVYCIFFLVAWFQVVTGAMTLKLAAALREDSALLELHEAGFFLIVLFIAAHLAAVFIHELVERRGLVSAMVHGCKIFTDEEIEALEGEP